MSYDYNYDYKDCKCFDSYDKKDGKGYDGAFKGGYDSVDFKGGYEYEKFDPCKPRPCPPKPEKLECWCFKKQEDHDKCDKCDKCNKCEKFDHKDNCCCQNRCCFNLCRFFR
ncbi:MAG TPA: hypothetical protein VIL24_03785 [Clostridia bacterium]